MNLLEDKQQIIDKLKETNEEWIIKSIKKLLDIPAQENHVVGYNAVGEPITIYNLKKDLEKGEKQFENGQYIDNDNLEEEIQKRKKK